MVELRLGKENYRVEIQCQNLPKKHSNWTVGELMGTVQTLWYSCWGSPFVSVSRCFLLRILSGISLFVSDNWQCEGRIGSSGAN